MHREHFKKTQETGETIIIIILLKRWYRDDDSTIQTPLLMFTAYLIVYCKKF
jgi:hypothetical protein